jgi:o-succinylbenzoate synthase
VKINSARLQHYRLPLRAPWVTAVGGFGWREGWLLRLGCDDGRCGYGDCAPLPGTGTESLAEAQAALSMFQRQLPGSAVADALAGLRHAAQTQASAARGAVECALLDLGAQAADLPLSRYLTHGASDRILLNAALGSLLQASDRVILAACAEGFSMLKFKAGTGPLADEILRLHEISRILPPQTTLRLDANGAWNEADASRFIDACVDLPIDMLEEPLAAPGVAGLRRLQANCRFPLAIDESWSALAVQDDLLLDPPVHRLVLKPPRLGGLLPALSLAQRASAVGVECIVTSSVDSACGVLCAAHLAAALDNGLAHGLATSCWLREDVGAPPLVTQGRMRLPVVAGSGFTPHPAPSPD